MKLNDAAYGEIDIRIPSAGKILLSLLRRIRQGRIDVFAPGGQRFVFEGESNGPAAQLQLSDWNVCADILKSGDIGFAEAYMDRRWDTPDLAALLELAAVNRSLLERALKGTWTGRLYYRLRHMLRPNTRRGARRNIHSHYDLGNDFYRAWLDESMTYSSGLFCGEPEISLEQAQTRKYERILQALNVGEHSRILEIGCGWGGFAEYAARSRNAQVFGITISREQLDFAVSRIARAGLSNSVELALCDYRDVIGEFDFVVSIEMLEAVGEAYWPAYFRTLHDRLGPGGRALVQTIVIADDLFEHYRRSTDFIQQYVFPGGMLPSRAILGKQAETAELRATESIAFGGDYAETLQRWRQRYNRCAPELRALGFDSRFERLWNFYLAYCEAGFRAGSIDVIQAGYERA